MRREWTMERKKERRRRRAFTLEFKADAVRLCKVGDHICLIGESAFAVDTTPVSTINLFEVLREELANKVLEVGSV
jgi:hypothetical protein